MCPLEKITKSNIVIDTSQRNATLYVAVKNDQLARLFYCSGFHVNTVLYSVFVLACTAPEQINN